MGGRERERLSWQILVPVSTPRNLYICSAIHIHMYNIYIYHSVVLIDFKGTPELRTLHRTPFLALSTTLQPLK